MKQSIRSLALVIRSKNAGPYELVLDILFRQQSDYLAIKASGQLTAQRIADLYHLGEQQLPRLIWFDPANAVKAVLPRSVVSGNRGDNDVYGAQQHAPLLDIVFDI